MIDYKQPIGKVLSIETDRDKLRFVVKFNSDIPQTQISKWIAFLERNGIKVTLNSKR